MFVQNLNAVLPQVSCDSPHMSYYGSFLTALFLCLFLLSLKERELSAQRESCLSFIKMIFIFSSERDSDILEDLAFP